MTRGHASYSDPPHPPADPRWHPTAAALAEEYEAAGASCWVRPADGASITRDTYQPTYRARRPDGTERHTYTAPNALLWIGPLVP